MEGKAQEGTFSRSAMEREMGRLSWKWATLREQG